MDNIKVLLTCIFITGCVTLSLSSCSSKGENEETAYVNAEYLDSLNKTINDYSASTQEQRETLFRIMKELDEIADEAFALGKERQLKGQVADMKMVDKVKYKLATIQTELNTAREKALENPELLSTIDNLKNQISEQEEYISHLRKSIRVKKGKLQARKIELEEANEQLENNKIAYENSNLRLAEEQKQVDAIIRDSWMSVGNKLEESSDQIKLLKKDGKLVGKTREAKVKILKRALTCYNKACELGNPVACQKASLVESKIQDLNKEE